LVYKVEYGKEAQKILKKMDKNSSQRIVKWMRERVSGCDNPRLWGEALVGEFTGLWKYRIGDFRVICEIKDHELVVLVVELGHRKEVYQ
jgi:mRNA interferase RelE/StbE